MDGDENEYKRPLIGRKAMSLLHVLEGECLLASRASGVGHCRLRKSPKSVRPLLRKCTAGRLGSLLCLVESPLGCSMEWEDELVNEGAFMVLHLIP